MVKSDLKINYWELRHLLNKIRQIQPAIDNFQKASANFRQAISEQEGKSIDELVKFYDENLDVRQKELQERLSIIEEVLVGYINGMMSYIAPVDELKTMRVDRYDIRINLNEIYSVVHQSSLVDAYIPESCDEYWRYYDYNPDLSEEENAANANEVYAENCAEQRRRQDNYNRIRNFNRSAALSYQIDLDNCYKVIEKIYEESIVPYEQKDDTYFQKLLGYYNQWATMRDHLHDLGEVQNSALRGGIDAIKDFGQGIAAIGHPKEMVEGLKAFAADPSNAIGQMFQDFMDRTDENGFFYGTTYIAADVGIGYVTDKGAHKALEALKGIKGLKYVDEMADAAEGTRKVITREDELWKETGRLAKEAFENSNSIVELDKWGNPYKVVSVDEATSLSDKLKKLIDDVPRGEGGNFRVPEPEKIKGIAVNEKGEARVIENWKPGTDGAKAGTRHMESINAIDSNGNKVLLDRIGGKSGNYFSPFAENGRPFSLKERAIGDYLPREKIWENDSYHLYEVQQDFTRENFEKAIKNSFIDEETIKLKKGTLDDYYSDAVDDFVTDGHNGEKYFNGRPDEADGIKTGEIDQMFLKDGDCYGKGTDGGGKQYITPFNVQELLEMGMIKEIK